MQNNPKPDLKLILRPKEDFRDIFHRAVPVHVISPLIPDENSNYL